MLSWTAPTLNTDGTPLSNLAGYKIRYGRGPAELTETLLIPTPGVTSAQVENLASGTWYFGVISYSTDGVESDLSNLAQKSI
jgi:hypothetical protein